MASETQCEQKGCPLDGNATKEYVRPILCILAHRFNDKSINDHIDVNAKFFLSRIVYDNLSATCAKAVTAAKAEIKKDETIKDKITIKVNRNGAYSNMKRKAEAKQVDFGMIIKNALINKLHS